MTPAINRASQTDAEQILALQRLAYESEARAYGDWSLPPLTQTIDELHEEFEDSLVLKATVGGQLVGSVRGRLAEGVCTIGRLMVHPDFQGRGIGSALLQAIETGFPDAVKYELFTGSRSDATIRLYEAHGYAITRSEWQSTAVMLVFLEKPGAKVGARWSRR